jgi:hypothetical protein
MNWKIIASGSFLILIVFGSFIGFQFIKNRNNNLLFPQNSNINEITYKEGELPINQQLTMEKEIESQAILVRGRVNSYNKQTKIITMAAESQQKDGSLAVVGLAEIKIEEKTINEFLCWPEFFKTADGKSEIDIKKAAMLVGGNSYLYMKGESKKTIDKIDLYLKGSPFIFVLLESSPAEVGQLLNDTSNLPVQTAKEISILGCQ